jgi:hypothetical protein
MQTNFPSSSGGIRRWGFIPCVLVLLACWSVQGAVSREHDTPGTGRHGSEGWAKVTVAQGRLSVDLRDADIAMVLSRIGEQAGFSLITGPIARRTISVQFTDTELMQGLRRLLRLASLSYALVYDARTASGVGLKELRVLSEGEGDTRSLPQVAARTVEAPTNDTQQLQQESPTPPNPFVEFLQRLPQPPPQGQPVPEPSPTPPNPFVEFLQRQQ